MHKRRRLVAIAAIAICLLVYCGYRADQAARSAAINASTRMPLQLQGTWKISDGAIFQLRPDGTGRSYTPGDGPPQIHYFEWMADDSTFTIIYAPRSVFFAFLAKSLGTETATFSIARQARDFFVVADGATETRFERTQDPVIESAE